MKKIIQLTVQNFSINLISREKDDFISLTDIARYKDQERIEHIIQNWLRNRETIEFLGLWEKINNQEFKHLEFEVFRKQAGLNSFSLTPQRWIESTNAIGIFSKSGRYGGGTFAHKDIAFEFASWISAEFKLFLIKEFQRLKEEENQRLELDWDVKRALTKINYKIHTDAIKMHLIPAEISSTATNTVYASEADVLNVALFGKTAKEWRDEHLEIEGNMRDYSDVTQLVVLANLESMNAELIRQGLPQKERVIQLNQVAIMQMQSLINNVSIKNLTKTALL